MTIDLVVVSWEAPQLLASCIHSLATNTDMEYTDFNIYIVDNNSGLETLSFLSKLGKSAHVTFLPENIYYGPALNIGIAQGEGEFVAIFNNDIVVPPGYCVLFQYLQEHPEVGVIGPKLITPEGRIIGVGVTDRRIRHRDRGTTLMDGPGVYPEVEDVVYVGGSAMFFPRKALEELKDKDGFYFDPQFTFYYEDFDICLRLEQMGYKVQYCPEATLTHVHQGTLPWKGREWRVDRYRENLPKFEAKWGHLLPL